MGGAPWGPPGLDVLVGRISTTEPDELRRSAAVLDRTSTTALDSAQRLRLAADGSAPIWRGHAGDAFRSHSGLVRRGLSELAAALSTIAAVLRAHADAADQARTVVTAAQAILRQADLPASLGVTYDQVRAARRLAARAADNFHESEISTRRRLWALGESAPVGGIPLVELPAPTQSWWQTILLGDPESQFWLDRRGMQVRADGQGVRLPDPESGAGSDSHSGPQQGAAPDLRRYDPDRPLYGWDEDGNLVPAFMAIPVVGALELVEAGSAPIGQILKFVARGGPTLRKAADARAAVADLVTASRSWQTGHVDKHIREFYNVAPNAVLDPWMKPAFLRVISEAGATRGRIVEWGLKGDQRTYALLHYDRDTGRRLLVEFYQEGKLANQFATAFMPSDFQLTSILAKSAMVPK